MIDSIIKDLNNDFVQIKILLSTSKTEDAEKALAGAAQNLKKFMEYADYSIFIRNYEKKLSEFIDRFMETSMIVSFASAYDLIDAYNHAVVVHDTPQAANLLQKVENKITFMEQSYLDAVHRGQNRTAAFIDFEKDFSYLLRYLEESKKEDGIQQMCNNFVKAMNFKETQQLFFYSPRTFNDKPNTPGEQMQFN